MQLNIKDLDQTHWVCYEFQNNKYYYGQVAYVDQNGNIFPKDNLEIASNPNAKLVKHGAGVFVYSNHNQIIQKYEGYWQKDKKNGYGKMFYDNNNVYKGNWKDDMKSENGKFIWANGDTYEGFWKRDRLDGVGFFKHHEGYEFKGNFRSNYFVQGQNLRNPFMTIAQYERFKKAKKDILKLKQKINKHKTGYIERVNKDNFEEIVKLINKSNNNNRIPLIFSSTKSNFEIQNFNKIMQHHKKATNVFDLRHIYSLKKEQRVKYQKQINKILINTLKNGQLFILNLDDSNTKYQQLFYPDIKQFYNPECFPSQIWSKHDLSNRQVYSQLGKQVTQVSKDFSLCIWTKFRISEELQNKKIIEKLERRFESVIPIIKIDYIFLTN